MAKIDPEIRAHREWLGLLQPVGLVVSPPALVKAQAVPSQNVAELQQHLISVVHNPPTSVQGSTDEPFIADLPAFFQGVLDWSLEDVAGADGGPALPEHLELALPDYGETLRPTYAVVDSMGDGEPLMLVQAVPRGTSLDKPPADDRKSGWSASPQARLERLLREVKVPTGILCNGDALRLVYAPSGESSGYLTFPVAEMCEVSGRKMLAALHMLLSEHRVFSAPAGRRLADIVVESRKYQAEVSNALSDQVLGALWELLRGFQASDPQEGMRVFDQAAREDPQHVYGGLLTLLMRLIFVLYAEDEGLMPKGEVYANNYSVSGLFDRLRLDAGRYPDTMDQRYGAYAWLLSLFRLVFDGGGHGDMRLPTRHGQLFDPNEYPFLEGRPLGVGRVVGDTFEAPRVSDGCIYRVLDALLMLDGERLSYRALDVEQVGSVYEAMMGYEVKRAAGRCLALRPKHIVVDADALLEVPGGKRKKWLKDEAEVDLTGAAAKTLKAATSPEEVVAALGRRISPRSLDTAGTPRLMPPGSLYLQPGEERRRTGSHYTPRELTEPIVRTTLRPVLEGLGERPTPRQVLDLKVCDPAMGSGAFLVEACRQLAQHLVTAWELHDALPSISADEEPILHARRMVAQRCLYGVDKNPFAVNLAKLSLWLVTLAKDHAFTFLDHSLRHGDSLVGLTREQISAFHWHTRSGSTADIFEHAITQSINAALGWRTRMRAGNDRDYTELSEAHWEAGAALADARVIGDLTVAAFFNADTDRDRSHLREDHLRRVREWILEHESAGHIEGLISTLRSGSRPVVPFHWEIEFPEVFVGGQGGFDAVVGNPPFAGKNTISEGHHSSYPDWLKAVHPGAHGNADLVAHFLRRSFSIVAPGGSLGLIATNTVRRGHTRSTGLGFICSNGGQIFAADRRMMWPGRASVVISKIYIVKGDAPIQRFLDGRPCRHISSFLFDRGGDQEPFKLKKSQGLGFQGSIPLGMGFTFDDTDKKGIASPISEMRRLIESDPSNNERIFPFIGYAEVANHPQHLPHRYIINFGEMTLEEAARWPDLLAIVEERVRPAREANRRNAIARKRADHWWMFGAPAKELYDSIRGLNRVLVTGAQAAAQYAFAFLPANYVFSSNLNVFPFNSWSSFALFQAQPHELWSRFFGSTRKDDFSYTPTTCLETFPFPQDWEEREALHSSAERCYAHRAAVMQNRQEGLTETYNRFHDPVNSDADIVILRDLHDHMDRAVLDAYGWNDIETSREFLLDYEIDEDAWGNKKKPYRYRWPDEVHDEVLARLLELNQKRYDEEVAAGLHDKSRTKAGKKKSGRKKPKARSLQTDSLSLFDDGE